jgi:hypothetical protein
MRRPRARPRQPGSRAAPGLRPGVLGPPARSWLTAVAFRSPAARRSDGPARSRRARAQGRRDAVRGQSAARRRMKTPRWERRGARASYARMRTRLAKRRGSDWMRRAALHPPLLVRGPRKTGEPGAHAKEYGRRSFGLPRRSPKGEGGLFDNCIGDASRARQPRLSSPRPASARCTSFGGFAVRRSAEREGGKRAIR